MEFKVIKLPAGIGGLSGDSNHFALNNNGELIVNIAGIFADMTDYYYPIGSTYVQYPSADVNIVDAATLEQVFPDALNPNTRFPGTTWVEDTSACFYRNRGTHREASENTNRTLGKQDDYSQGFKASGLIYSNGASPHTHNGVSNIASQATNDGVASSDLTITLSDDGTHGVPRWSKENYPVNKLKRTFIRTA